MVTGNLKANDIKLCIYFKVLPEKERDMFFQTNNVVTNPEIGQQLSLLKNQRNLNNVLSIKYCS